MSAPVLIMAGGTGGHIFPGIAVAADLRRRNIPVAWLGGSAGLESRLVPEAGIALESIAFSGVRGKGALTLLAAPLRLLRAVLAARRILRRLRPRCVLSMGGYAAAPGGIAAWLSRVPLVVHEQNRVPGFTNRLLRRFARRVLEGFSGSLDGALWVGNPVRDEIGRLPAPQQRLAGREGPVRILVLGGSQGARSLNVILPELIRRRGDRVALQVRHQCGERHLDKTRELYSAADVEAEIVPFIKDMAAAYAWADLVICRAGALTLAELCAAGCASILVPFPAAVDDHQTRNAEVLVDAGAAILVAEGDGFVKRLGTSLDELDRDRPRLLKMAACARGLARPDAAVRIADICLEVAA
ncbi:MAG: undecaprenyldiphospho-muramoylpentapeptide beta-N-acetylglucosaminyltransferase [Dokdonella sp.]|nr:undecaprenyldiphospho-muramoylpentapeptide beta-N-acetylglucosaminyltransferase [Dokdonella sp.]MCB1570461.1 undecaprenyldiphospho-muramoylpentapeptide beta-N-acetylglucosaminyltransferase [Xanthomonadales bacterium]MCB1572768.1 undecaprenyldiphospho-muramoylpentapeptide beta-N-acetylglucosaminyltransferase [Xanthomonadales bacterium]MCB1576965.1 undecaprenyldiphospho-muramoylpentapeptide beta-N-acetylglucosaminyltransferase [Xanthomonadales bacterium]MCB1941380.1 undecaprenyldiphospho-muram